MNPQPATRQALFTKRLALAALCIGACLALAACGGAPSDSDMRAALDKQIDAQMKSVEGFAGKKAADMAPKITDLKKIGCKDDGEKAYRCDVELEVLHMGAKNRATRSMRFVKASDGWAAAD